MFPEVNFSGQETSLDTTKTGLLTTFILGVVNIVPTFAALFVLPRIFLNSVMFQSLRYCSAFKVSGICVVVGAGVVGLRVVESVWY